MSPLIELSGVELRYPGQAQAALGGVDLQIPAGGVFALLGPNGAGKTTLLSALLGLRPISAGTMRLDGIDPARDPAAVRRRCALAPQHLAFYPTLTVIENLRCFAGLGGLRGDEAARRIDAVVERTQLGDRLPQLARALSGGLQRRLNLAIALLGEPQVLCLDEPTVGVDPQARRFLLSVIRDLAETGTTVLYTSHYLDEVERLADRVAILDRGRIRMQGRIDELLSGVGLRVQLDRAPDAAERASLLDGDGGWTVDGAMLRHDGDEALAAFERLRPRLASQRLALRSMRYGAASLEQRYLELTGEALRDE